jgi:flagellar assembly factor FliW
MTGTPPAGPQYGDEPPAREIVFPNGLPGFKHLHRFKLLTDAAYYPPFELLESTDERSIGFYVVDPHLIDPAYDPDVPEADAQVLLIRDTDEVLLRAIITVGREPSQTTANLAAPVIINLTAGLGIQAVLEDAGYSLRTPLLEAGTEGR